MLYDAESMMAISKSIARGYLVLLGSINDKNSQEDKRDISLAFMALVHGNVIDSCFGIRGPPFQPETPASRVVREAKGTMNKCGQSDAFRVVAVEAYIQAFETVIMYRKQYKRTNWISRCFRSKMLRERCEAQLRESFLGLALAIAEQN